MDPRDEHTDTDEILENHARVQRQCAEVVQVHFPEVSGALFEKQVVNCVLNYVAHTDERILKEVRVLFLVGHSFVDLRNGSRTAKTRWKVRGILQDEVAADGATGVEAEFVEGGTGTGSTIIHFLHVVLVFAVDFDKRPQNIYYLPFKAVEGEC